MSTVTGGMKKATVLLAEDNPADQQIARRALERGALRCDLRIVADGEEAMDYLLHRGRYADPRSAPRPDLILLDLNMPKLDGRQVLDQVKHSLELSSIPVVIFTTSEKEEDVNSSYQLGCNSFVRKPVDIHDFIGVLSELERYWLKLVLLPSR